MIYLSIFYKFRLQRIILLLVLAFYSLVLCAQFVDYERITPHPRLLLTQGGEEAVKKSIATFPSLLKVHKRILEESDEILIQQMAERVMEGKRLLSVSRLVLKRIFYLSYAYRMTKEEKYAYRATQEMLSVSRFPDWNPSHFLDVGEMVLALSIGYDWLYEYLESETRSIVRDAIVEKGLDAAAPDEWFYRAASNWNSVCNAGLLYGALAIFEDVPDKAKKIIERCLLTNPKALSAYGPDGGYPEGFHYWGYGTSFQVLLIAVLESALGTDAGLSEYPGFLESARFMEFMTAPSGEAYFEVSKTGQPFIVNVNGMQVEVLGTTFNISAYPNEEYQTTLVNGSVRVSAEKGESLILKPSQQATIVSGGNSIQVRTVDTSFYTSWVKGKINFKDQRLEDIMKILSRWYDMNVVYENEKLKNIRFGCNLNRYEEITPFVKLLEKTEEVHVKIEGNTITFHN